MSEKRFSVEDYDADIWEDNHFLAVAYDHHNALKIAERLNNLSDKNEQLKKELESFKPIIFESDGKPVTLYKKGDVE